MKNIAPNIEFRKIIKHGNKRHRCNKKSAGKPTFLKLILHFSFKECLITVY